MHKSSNFWNIDFFRKIDYWLGVPICFFLNGFYVIGKIFRITKQHNPEKVLFIELSEMGSTVLAYAAMRKLKELFPYSELCFMIFNKNAESVHILNIIPPENVIVIDDKSFIKFVITSIKAIIKCRQESIDTVIDMELFSRISAILSYLSGAKNRVGFYRFSMEGLYRGNMLTHKVGYNPHQHIGINFLALVYSLMAPASEYPLLKKHISKNELHVPEIKSSEEAKEKMWLKLKSLNDNLNTSHKLVIVNPNAGLLCIRAWPIEHYAALCKKITDNYDSMIIITGVGEAQCDAETIISKVGIEKCINLVNKTTFRELIDLYNTCDLIITNDSGPVHFAALTPIQIIAFFGPETHKLYAPIGDCVTIFNSDFFCSPCLSAFNHRKTVCDDNLCLKTVSVESVYNSVKDLIS